MSSSTFEPNDRRRFRRIPFDATTELLIDLQRWPVQLVDISLKGLLAEAPQALDCPLGTCCDATVTLSANGIELQMAVKLVHRSGQLMGFECQHIDLDSITHLRRLVELNLGDQELLDRELEQLLPL